MGFSRQEYWRGLPSSFPGDLPNPGIKPVSSALQADSYHLSYQGSPIYIVRSLEYLLYLNKIKWSKVKVNSVISNCLQPKESPPGRNTGVGSLSLLQRIFPNQGSNPGLPHCRQILYQLSHKGSSRILTGVGSLSLLRGIFLTEELNQGLLHCKLILYQLSHKGSLGTNLQQGEGNLNRKRLMLIKRK